MRILMLLVCLTRSLCVAAQVLCGTAAENGTVTLTAPAGNKFTAVEFASYGTPNGSCGAFTTSGCHSATSVTVCSNAWLNKTTASVGATNAVFGDPCSGTVKRLYVQLRYAAIVPLTLVSFTAKQIEENVIRLDWRSENEYNTSHFIVERSSDGIFYSETGRVASNGEGSGNYHFTDTIPVLGNAYFYRLKMVDRDETFEYSHITRIKTASTGELVSVWPNPAGDNMTIESEQPQEIFLTNSLGIILKKIRLQNGRQTVDLSHLSPGIYFIKAKSSVFRFVKK